ncbi:hypothetical protein [uncultured Brevundimonas sp.]|uniref:HNH endonuclease n=1 Tax=uncultured Brevundimonas sp. TaxID=213418 RepID=UPI0025EAF2B2|nr:hypothetical protein [uncultured Brevundimonas sp.]
MRPDVSLIPAPDRSTEKRVPLTPKQRAQLALDQNGRCGCGCGERLDHAREGTIDEHIVALALGGSNDLSNRAIWRKPCSAVKTAKDMAFIARAKRRAGETCQGEPARKLQGRGFGSVSRGFDGKIKLTKKAARTQAANDGAASSSNREG